jgi:hypothetical protein
MPCSGWSTSADFAMPMLLTLSFDLRFLIFPALLLICLFLCWLKAGKDPKLAGVMPEYAPPAGISPATARYILTGGSDGTSLAAVLVQLSARRVVSIEPRDGIFHLELLHKDAAMEPEEAAAITALFQFGPVAKPTPGAAPSQGALAEEIRQAVQKIPSQELASQGLAVAAELSSEARPTADINPRIQNQVEPAVEAIQKALQVKYRGVFFTWNFRYVGVAMLATFLYGIFTAAFLGAGNALFLTFWFSFFTGGAGTVIVMSQAAKPARPSMSQRMKEIVFPLAFFVFPATTIGAFALPQYFLFIVGLVLCSVINSVFLVLMRAPTRAGQEVLQHLAGFREFLVRVEQDRMERLNTPEEKTRVMSEFMAYAVALGVREGWGDRMASAFSDAAVQR